MSPLVSNYQAVIERLAEEAHAEIARMVRRARTRLHLPPYYLGEGRRLVMPAWLKCPECGAPIVIEIDEWGTKDGMPTAGGIRVSCKAEDEEFCKAMDEDRDLDPDIEHRMWQSDWQHIVDRAERFCARYVRVAPC